MIEAAMAEQAEKQKNHPPAKFELPGGEEIVWKPPILYNGEYRCAKWAKVVIENKTGTPRRHMRIYNEAGEEMGHKSTLNDDLYKVLIEIPAYEQSLQVLHRHLDAIDTNAVPRDGSESQQYSEWSRARNVMDVQNFRRLLQLFNKVLYRHEFGSRDGVELEYA